MKAKMYNKNWWIKETREKVLDNSLSALLRESGFSVRGSLEEEFSPYGYTRLWLLAESHLAVHTFPEEGLAYVELSSCNEDYARAFVDRFERIYDTE